MTRQAVPHRPLGPMDAVREALDRLESRLANLDGAGEDVLEVLFLLDRATELLEGVAGSPVDARAERTRLASAWGKLQRNARRFLREAGPALARTRAERGDAAQLAPWWFLDRDVALAQRRRLARGAALALLAAGLVAIGAWLYDRFVAPPPEVTQAFQYESLAEEEIALGNLDAALSAAEQVVALRPDSPQAHVRVGVLREATGDPVGGQAAYDAARSLGLEEVDVLFQRGMAWLWVGDVQRAARDADAVVALSPDWGYGYYLRALTAAEAGDAPAAADDFERAAELADVAGDVTLQSMARVNLALLFQVP
ncbi:MAG: hypothetical protein JXD18_04700 [Anaerolineae bacterium]|nr:hypothetical protein [Anaerolineae bacterium]